MLENYREHLLQILDERHALYDQCLHLALFNRDAEQAESWMTAQVCILFMLMHYSLRQRLQFWLRTGFGSQTRILSFSIFSGLLISL